MHRRGIRNNEGEHSRIGWRRCNGLRCNRIGWSCSGGVAQRVLQRHLTSQEIDLLLQGGAWVAAYDWKGPPCTITMDGNGGVLDDVYPNEQPLRMLLCMNG
jgi:hypothetical protein